MEISEVVSQPVKAAAQTLASLPYPTLGTLDAYIKAVNEIPMLSLEDEREYGLRVRDGGDTFAAERLILSHLRLPVSVARGYSGYGIPHADLIQEGNLGLMRAVKGFDPEIGGRLCTYAMPWIKANIHEYAVRNTRVVKTATTKPMRKLFFNLRSIKNRMQAESDRPMKSLTVAQTAEIAKTLNVLPSEVSEMERRLSGYDVAMDNDDDSEEIDRSPSAYLSDDNYEPSRQLEMLQKHDLEVNGLAAALETLDPRSKAIVKQRWIDLREDDSGATLADMGKIYGISTERVRQIEAVALKKIKKYLLGL